MGGTILKIVFSSTGTFQAILLRGSSVTAGRLMAWCPLDLRVQPTVPLERSRVSFQGYFKAGTLSPVHMQDFCATSGRRSVSYHSDARFLTSLHDSVFFRKRSRERPTQKPHPWALSVKRILSQRELTTHRVQSRTSLPQELHQFKFGWLLRTCGSVLRRRCACHVEPQIPKPRQFTVDPT